MSKGRRGKRPSRNPNPLLVAGGFLASVLSLGAYQMVSTKTPPPEIPNPTPPDTTSSTPVITPTTAKPSASPSASTSATPTPTPKPKVSKVYRLPPTPTPRTEPVTPVTPKHEAPPKATPPPAPKPVRPPPSVAAMTVLLSFLRAQVGKPYVFGGTGPDAFDCSGLIQTAFSRVGVTLPRTSESQSAVGYGVPLSAVRPGDILYWGPSGSAGHTAVYIGGGEFLAAQNPRVGVVIRPVSPYDPPSGARRIQI